MSVEQAMLMSEGFFFFSLCSTWWEDLCALSHAAVKDSCHPVSGSNTHTHTHRAVRTHRSQVTPLFLLQVIAKTPNKGREEDRFNVFPRKSFFLFGLVFWRHAGAKTKNTTR